MIFQRSFTLLSHCVFFFFIVFADTTCGGTDQEKDTQTDTQQTDAQNEDSDSSEPIEPVGNPDFDQFVEGLLEQYNLSSIALAIVKDREVLLAKGYGVADQTTSHTADVDTIYMIASCSKPVVGLALLKMMEDPRIEFDLDEDINTYLDWDERLEHPDYPDTPVTMRHLIEHRSGIDSDSDEDYETYPRPDPDRELDDYLQELLLDPDYWLYTEPGTDYAYSNLGVSLAGLVIEKAAGKPFNEFCNDELFEPLDLDDTRWFFKEYSLAQQERMARPHNVDLEPYEHYAFNDYPSGLLKTTVMDLSKLLIMLMNDGMYNGERIMEPESVLLFETMPVLIESFEEDGVKHFEHSGGERGINTYFIYRDDDMALMYFINTDMEDDSLDDFAVALEARMLEEALRSE